MEKGKVPYRRKKKKRTSKVSEILLKVNNELVVAKTLDEAFDTLVNITTEILKAERGTVFLNDEKTDELFSRVQQGNFKREIRILNHNGVAGWVFTNNECAIINDAYNDPRFNSEIDQKTGFKTHSILCVPLRTLTGELIGVTQILNKDGDQGEFSEDDLDLLLAMTEQAAVALQNKIIIEEMEEARSQEMEFLNVVSSVSSEIKLGPLLQKIISAISKMLEAERATLFINDDKTNELFTEVGEGLGKTVIRFPNHLGIAGTVFTSERPLNLPHAYADLRFNPAFDKKTGFFTRSILCVPVFNKDGKVIGVTQVLNKKGGPFREEDEARLNAFTSQISMGIENAKLFDDVQNMQNYNEGMLESMSNGVISVDENGNIQKINAAAGRIFKVEEREEILGKNVKEFFIGSNEWILEFFQKTGESGIPEDLFDQEVEFENEKISINLSFRPLINVKEEKLGTMLVFEDISSEKRMKSTMSRYMDADLADKLMEGGEDLLGGASSVATVLFSDIRSFTTLTEELGAQGTVSFLNEYFTVMVDCIQNEGGMLDKFIGDAIMAIFGTPFPHEDDPDRGMRAAIKMMTELAPFNEKRLRDGKKPIDHGMGLNTGHIVSGNIGSPKRMDYTVIGDGVNLAARLESACNQYGAHILISEFTYGSLKSTYRAREIDKVVVKGKTEAVGVYEIMDYHTDNSYPNLVESLGHFHDGFEYYQKGHFDQAIKQFKICLNLNPEDKTSQMYVDRCEFLKANPPEGEWNGVWIMKSK